ncbi:A-kinase anchor protein 1, mitochondrial [Hemicordylus capensis]|uniref:A-kinase anchor protein 1, mitochondrial n=1 Tax=Hemicordylus capensis TaxID=884348 RepID=UPI002303B80C|nr:A-kinase anchor protein 1, mitochondrial [Hemicordylus capensis]
MALRFHKLLPFAIPGVLALIGWWWFSSRKKERASNRGRQDLAGLEEDRIGSPKRQPGSKDDASDKRPLPLAVAQTAEGAFALESSGRRAPSPESSAQSLDPSKPHPVVPEPAVGSDTLQDNSQKLETAISQGGFGSPAQMSSLQETRRAGDSLHTEGAAEEKLEPTQGAEQMPEVGWASPPETSRLEEPEDSPDVAVQKDASEKPWREGLSLASTSVGAGSSPVPCSEAASQTLPKALAGVDDPKMEEINGGAGGGLEREVAVLTQRLLEPASSALPPKEEMSSSDTDRTLASSGVREGGYKTCLEKERPGGVGLEREVETIEQVAIHIISRVILAATEEVLSGSVGDMSDRICQVTVGRIDAPLEKVPVGQVESSKGAEIPPEKASTVSPAPLLEEHVNHHVTFSSHLTHGLLTNPGRRLMDCVGLVPSGGDLTVVANLEEAFEDAHTVTEDSGCSACTSEDGTSAEELLKNSSACEQDFLTRTSVQDLAHHSAPSRKPHSPALPENQVPYSNGVLKEDCQDRRHDQPWPAEADTDHSGGSDVNSMDSVDSGCALRKKDSCPSSKTGVESNKMELVIWEIEVPKHLVGRLIGKQGRYVSFLKQASGAKIYISTLPYTQDFQICHIEGSQQNVDKALSLIGKKFKDLSLTNIYAPPPPSLPLHSLPMTSWLMLPDGVTVEVIVVNQINAGHLFVQQHTHPTFHVLRSLDQQMYLCYSQPGIPTMPTPVEVGVVCAAPGVEGAWWRAQVVGYFKDAGEVEIRYVDYGGYERVKIETLRQIRSDFVTLPFQGAEVLLDNVVPLPDEDQFSSEADTAVSDMTRGSPLLAQVTNYDSPTGLPLIQLWSMIGDELVSINRTLVEKGFAQWVESY